MCLKLSHQGINDSRLPENIDKDASIGPTSLVEEWHHRIDFRLFILKVEPQSSEPLLQTIDLCGSVNDIFYVLSDILRRQSHY